MMYVHTAFVLNVNMYEKSFFAYRLSQLIGHLLLLFWLPPAPVLCVTVITVKQAFGNHGLLAGYGAKP